MGDTDSNLTYIVHTKKKQCNWFLPHPSLWLEDAILIWKTIIVKMVGNYCNYVNRECLLNSNSIIEFEKIKIKKSAEFKFEFQIQIEIQINVYNLQ